MTGCWRSDGSIRLYPTADQLRIAVSCAHAAGLKIYPWIVSEPSWGDVIDVSTPARRQAAINTMVNLVQAYGFDGFADDVEYMSPWTYSGLVTYYNDATVAMHAIGKEYFTALVTFWADMGEELFESIHVDRLQPMLYGDYYDVRETIFSEHADYFLAHSSSPVGLAIHSDHRIYWPLADSMSWLDKQLHSSPTDMLAGIDIFWLDGMTYTQWNAWDSWNTKD